ncbi:hypothetical protein JCGZ_19124 [Jatropha curcas]|uniref:RING-type E3 ubiquitin transferase n=2 Tax=Jatropha curcas TaxID=180498 RepID=A0A067K0C5_JATCU|nr:RING-H2 finger protein ATL51 isoform X2 [Jatropha curcas]KDP29597.1 hypothetical protein JCGZ_19124 [Jatropha curcas]
MNNRDCSQGFCSLYCPQWCYVIFPPPPPFYDFPNDNSSSPLSPLFIAIIGILASAFLLVSYYTIISKYCGNNNHSSRIRREDQEIGSEEFEDNNHNPSLHEPWNLVTNGLDEALIKSITIVKYEKGDGLIEGTDCSVCLSEFQEDDNLRLLPKCSHAFHVSCIDTWLKSHSNCPLCRANIAILSLSLTPLPPSLPQPLPPPPPLAESLQTSGVVSESSEEIIVQNNGVPKTPFRVFSDLGNLQQRDIVIEIRRSFSMDHPYEGRNSVAEDCSSGHPVEQISKCSHRRRVLQCVLNPVTMKRSFSCGRFFLARHGRVRDNVSYV